MIYGNKFLNEASNNKEMPKTINFFGDEYKIKFLNNFDDSNLSDLPQNVINKMITIANTIGKRNDVFEKFYKNLGIYDDDFLDRIKSGKDVIKSIKNDKKNKERGFTIVYNKDYKSDSYFYLYFCGEYEDIDEEHGFSIRFYNGEYNKLVFGGYSDAL